MLEQLHTTTLRQMKHGFYQVGQEFETLRSEMLAWQWTNSACEEQPRSHHSGTLTFLLDPPEVKGPPPTKCQTLTLTELEPFAPVHQLAPSASSVAFDEASLKKSNSHVTRSSDRVGSLVWSGDELAERVEALERDLASTKHIVAHDCLGLARGAVKDSHELRTQVWSRDRTKKTSVDKPKTNKMEKFEKLTSLDVSHSYTYHFQETVWDAAVFWGFGDIGVMANVLLGIGFFSNVTLQCLFCWIVSGLSDEFNNFTDDIVDAFGVWRETATPSSLASICSLAEIVPSTDYHTWNTVHDASNYSRSMMPYVEHGPLLCIIVLIAWTLNICKITKISLDFVWSMHQKMDSDTKEFVLGWHLQRFSIDRVPLPRVVWAYILGFVQVGISMFLLFVGARWLVTTTRASDLVLNAVALTYIMEIDELMFATVVPRQVHDIITSLEPITIETRSTCSPWRAQLPTRSLVALLAMVAFVMYAALVELDSHTHQVHRVLTAICG